METDNRLDEVVEHETDDSDDSEFEDALEQLVLASGVENVASATIATTEATTTVPQKQVKLRLVGVQRIERRKWPKK